MDKLPTEIVIEILIKTDYDELMALVKTNRTINDIYNQHKEYIYRQKLHMDYPCIRTSEDLYFQLYNSWDEYERVCELRKVYTEPECKDIMSYLNRTLVYINRQGRKGPPEDQNRTKIRLLIRMFTSLDNCYGSVNPKYKGDFVNKLKEADRDIRKSKAISRETLDRWTQFYDTVGQRLINKFIRENQ